MLFRTLRSVFTVTASIVAVSLAVLLVDLLHPLLDPRVRGH